MDASIQEAIDKSHDELKYIIKELSEKCEKIDVLEKAFQKFEETGGHRKEADRFQHKDAKDVKPGTWDEIIPFLDMMMEMKTWSAALHEDYIELMETAEKGPIIFLDETIEQNLKQPIIFLEQRHS